MCRFTMRNREACRWALKLKTKSSVVPVVKEMHTGSGSVGLFDLKKTSFGCCVFFLLGFEVVVVTRLFT